MIPVVLLLAVLMPQPYGDLLRRDHDVVVGAPGCGKTPFAAELVEGGRTAQAVGLGFRAAHRVVYFDPTGEWSRHGERVSPGDLRDPSLLSQRFVRLVVVPDDATLLADFAQTEHACRAAAPYGGLVLVVDEVGDLTESGGADILRGLHRNGHKDGVATILVSPCWTDIPARCRSTASRVFSFYQRRLDDVRALNAELGDGFGDRAARWQYPAPPVAWTSPTLH